MSDFQNRFKDRISVVGKTGQRGSFSPSTKPTHRSSASISRGAAGSVPRSRQRSADLQPQSQRGPSQAELERQLEAEMDQQQAEDEDAHKQQDELAFEPLPDELPTNDSARSSARDSRRAQQQPLDDDLAEDDDAHTQAAATGHFAVHHGDEFLDADGADDAADAEEDDGLTLAERQAREDEEDARYLAMASAGMTQEDALDEGDDQPEQEEDDGDAQDAEPEIDDAAESESQAEADAQADATADTQTQSLADLTAHVESTARSSFSTAAATPARVPSASPPSARRTERRTAAQTGAAIMAHSRSSSSVSAASKPSKPSLKDLKNSYATALPGLVATQHKSNASYSAAHASKQADDLPSARSSSHPSVVAGGGTVSVTASAAAYFGNNTPHSPTASARQAIAHANNHASGYQAAAAVLNAPQAPYAHQFTHVQMQAQQQPPQQQMYPSPYPSAAPSYPYPAQPYPYADPSQAAYYGYPPQQAAYPASYPPQQVAAGYPGGYPAEYPPTAADPYAAYYAAQAAAYAQQQQQQQQHQQQSQQAYYDPSLAPAGVVDDAASSVQSQPRRAGGAAAPPAAAGRRAKPVAGSASTVTTTVNSRRAAAVTGPNSPPRVRGTTQTGAPQPPRQGLGAGAAQKPSSDVAGERRRRGEYRPHTLAEFRDLNLNVKLGSLGPDLDNEERKAKEASNARVRALAAQIREENLAKAADAAAAAKARGPRREPVKEPTAAERAKEFAARVPKPRAKRVSADEDAEPQMVPQRIAGSSASTLVPRTKSPERTRGLEPPVFHSKAGSTGFMTGTNAANKKTTRPSPSQSDLTSPTGGASDPDHELAEMLQRQAAQRASVEKMKKQMGI